MMQTLVGLISILKDFEVTLNELTSLPLELDAFAFVTKPKDTIWLKFEHSNTH